MRQRERCAPWPDTAQREYEKGTRDRHRLTGHQARNRTHFTYYSQTRTHIGSTRMHPFTSFPLLKGYRNKPAADLRSLRDVLLKVSYLGAQIPELAQLEFNPVIAMPAGHGCQIVDARARVKGIQSVKGFRIDGCGAN